MSNWQNKEMRGRSGGGGAAAVSAAAAAAELEEKVDGLAGVEQVWYKHATEAWARGRLVGKVGGTMVRVLGADAYRNHRWALVRWGRSATRLVCRPHAPSTRLAAVATT